MSAPALDADLAVSRAAAAARRGELDAAAEVLTALETDDPAVFDLLARIRAQQGRWRDADEYWARVQAGDPEHAGAAEGRRVLAGVLAGKRPPRPVAQPARVAVVGGVLAVAAVAGGAVAVAGDDPPRPVSTAPAAATPSPTAIGDGERQRAEELARRLAKVEAERSAAAEQLTARLNVIKRQLTMPGAVVKPQSGAVEVYFREGLFIEDTRLTAHGAALLEEVGRRLDDVDASITVVGHSVPVPGGRTSGGSGTALHRAEVAARKLSEASGLPLTAFAMRSAEQSERPFERESRNRTVSLILTPA